MSDRKSFVFPPAASERLERLRVVTRQGTSSHVVRLALMVLEDTVKATNNGSIVFLDKDGKQTRTYHPLLEPEPVEAEQ